MTCPSCACPMILLLCPTTVLGQTENLPALVCTCCATIATVSQGQLVEFPGLYARQLQASTRVLRSLRPVRPARPS